MTGKPYSAKLRRTASNGGRYGFGSTIQMTIDDRSLAEPGRQDELTRKTTRPGSIRDALEAEVRRIRIREEEARHAEGYARKPVTPGEFDVWLDEQD